MQGAERAFGRKASVDRASETAAAEKGVTHLVVGIEEPNRPIHPFARQEQGPTHGIERLGLFADTLAAATIFTHAVAVPAPFGQVDRFAGQVGITEAQHVAHTAQAGARIFRRHTHAHAVGRIGHAVAVDVERIDKGRFAAGQARPQIGAAGGVGRIRPTCLEGGGHNDQGWVARFGAGGHAAQDGLVEGRRIVPRFVAHFQRTDMAGAKGGAKVTGKGVAIVVGRGIGVVPDALRHILVGELDADMDGQAPLLPLAIFGVPVEPPVRLGAAAIRHFGVIGCMVGVGDIPEQVVIVAGMGGDLAIKARAAVRVIQIGIVGPPTPDAVDAQKVGQGVRVYGYGAGRAILPIAVIDGHFPDVNFGPVAHDHAVTQLHIARLLWRRQPGVDQGRGARVEIGGFPPSDAVVTEQQRGGNGVGRPMFAVDPAHFS